MGKVVLENLSTKRLVMIAAAVVAIMTSLFLIGGLIAPAPNSTMPVLGTKCIDSTPNNKEKPWFYRRDKDRIVQNCHEFDNFKEVTGADSSQVVFIFQMPLPRDNRVLDFSRWQQSLIGVASMEIKYNPNNHPADKSIHFNVRLGYRNKHDAESDWTELHYNDNVKRDLNCQISEEEMEEGSMFSCDLIDLFELGTLHHDYYLLNVRLIRDEAKQQNIALGELSDIYLTMIHQNGGFTKVWFSVKTVMFPATLLVLVWFWRRVARLQRRSSLLERTLMTLGIGLTVLNVPVEWLSLSMDMNVWPLLSDIRQGVFYAVLLCFWLIFIGEHSMDTLESHELRHYWKQLTCVCVSCLCLLIFDLCERGIQINNPFFSIWSTGIFAKLALAIVVVAGIGAGSYFLVLIYMIVRVMRNISHKRTALPAMSDARRRYYLNLIFRFRFMMLVTLVCAAVTLVFFVLSQVAETDWKWADEPSSIEYSSAFIVGVYGMWNLYVMSLLFLYAPTRKVVNSEEIEPLAGSDTQPSDDLQMSSLPTESSALATFATTLTKPATD